MAENHTKRTSTHPTLPHTNPIDWGPKNTFASKLRKTTIVVISDQYQGGDKVIF